MSRLDRNKNAIALAEPIQLVEVGPVKGNPMLTEVKIKIAYHGFNRNGSYISKEVMENMIRRTLALTPVVGNYVKGKKDFGGHDSHIEISDQYEVEEVRDTVVYGVVGENPEVYWQRHVEANGKVKEYITTNAFMFTTRFKEAKRVLENENWQSMEIDPKTVIGDFEVVQDDSWDNLQNHGREVFNIKEANLIGLCILGADIEPAFESSDIRAVFSLIRKEEEDKKGDFMSNLKKALQYNFNDDAYNEATKNAVTKESNEFEDESGVGLTVADVDTTQEIEDIKNSINRLDDAADKEVNPDSQSAIDEAIDTMLKVEQELDIEDQLIPISDKAKEVAESMPGGVKDIVHSPTFEKAKPLVKPFEEEEEMPLDKKKEEEVLALQGEEKDPAAPVAEEPAVEPAAPAVDPKPAVQEVTVQVEDDPAPAAPVAAPAAIDPATGLPVEPVVEEGPARKTADEKRKDIELAKYGEEELLHVLLSKIQAADSIREQITQLVQGTPTGATAEAVPGEGVPAEAVPGDAGDAASFKKEEEEQAPEQAPIGEEVPAEPAKEEPVAEPAKEEAPAEEPKAEEPAKEEAPAPAEDEEEKKKKKGIQHFELEKMALDFAKLQLAFDNLEAEAKELREFKNAVENQEKESLLAQFSLLEDSVKEEIRTNFSNLSKEDIEAKCALEYYRKGLLGKGQDSSATDAIVSYNLEEPATDNLPGWVKALKSSGK